MRSRFALPRVTAVRHLHDHVLWVAFDDSVSGTVDLADRLHGPALEPLRNPALFASVRLGADTIEWPNGVDWSPESLHADVVALNRLAQLESDDGVIREIAHRADVPEISRFYGIVITMFYDDREPPHFHARLSGETVAIEIDGDGIRGAFPANRLSLLFEWRDRHRAELLENWNRMRQGLTPLPVAPLV